MNKIKSLLLTFALLIGAVGFVAQPVAAINVFEDSCKTNTTDAVCNEAKKGTDGAPVLVQQLINTLLYVIGIIAVIVIIVGAIRYVTSDGDSNKVSSAKNTILYAVIGLVVAMLAFAIVNFVVAQF